VWELFPCYPQKFFAYICGYKLRLYGGLNQIMGFRRLILLGWFSFVCWWNLSSWLYPLFFRASWYNGVHSAKLVVSDEIYDRWLLIESSMLCSIEGGWLDLICTYVGLLFGLLNGLYFPAYRSRRTSRKFTTFLFASIVIFRPSCLNMLHVFFY